jgi:protein-tyrosine phosphatase
MSIPITELPFGLPGKVYRSVMPFGLYDREGKVYLAYLEANISTVVILAESSEILAKSGRDLRMLYLQHGMDLLHLPIQDYDIPDPKLLMQTVTAALDLVRHGKNIAIHCSGGIGRTGMMLACMAKLVFHTDGEQSIAWVRKYVPGAVETDSQRQLVIDF